MGSRKNAENSAPKRVVKVRSKIVKRGASSNMRLTVKMVQNQQRSPKISVKRPKRRVVSAATLSGSKTLKNVSYSASPMLIVAKSQLLDRHRTQKISAMVCLKSAKTSVMAREANSLSKPVSKNAWIRLAVRIPSQLRILSLQNQHLPVPTNAMKLVVMTENASNI